MKTWNKLPEKAKKAFIDLRDWGQQEDLKINTRLIEQGRTVARKMGHPIITLTPEEREKWTKLVITKSCVIYIPPNVVHSPWKPLYAKHPWMFIEVNQGPVHTEKGYHQCLKPEQWNSPDLMRTPFADDNY